MPRKNEHVTQKIRKNQEKDAKMASEWSKKYHKGPFNGVRFDRSIDIYKNNIVRRKNDGGD